MPPPLAAPASAMSAPAKDDERERRVVVERAGRGERRELPERVAREGDGVDVAAQALPAGEGGAEDRGLGEARGLLDARRRGRSRRAPSRPRAGRAARRRRGRASRRPGSPGPGKTTAVALEESTHRPSVAPPSPPSRPADRGGQTHGSGGSGPPRMPNFSAQQAQPLRAGPLPPGCGPRACGRPRSCAPSPCAGRGAAARRSRGSSRPSRCREHVLLALGEPGPGGRLDVALVEDGHPEPDHPHRPRDVRRGPVLRDEAVRPAGPRGRRADAPRARDEQHPQPRPLEVEALADVRPGLLADEEVDQRDLGLVAAGELEGLRGVRADRQRSTQAARRASAGSPSGRRRGRRRPGRGAAPPRARLELTTRRTSQVPGWRPNSTMPPRFSASSAASRRPTPGASGPTARRRRSPPRARASAPGAAPGRRPAPSACLRALRIASARTDWASASAAAGTSASSPSTVEPEVRVLLLQPLELGGERRARRPRGPAERALQRGAQLAQRGVHLLDAALAQLALQRRGRAEREGDPEQPLDDGRRGCHGPGRCVPRAGGRVRTGGSRSVRAIATASVLPRVQRRSRRSSSSGEAARLEQDHADPPPRPRWGRRPARPPPRGPRTRRDAPSSARRVPARRGPPRAPGGRRARARG